MGTVIKRYTEEDVASVVAFNRRIAAINGYGEFQLPEQPPAQNGHPSSEQCYLAVADGLVRGGFILNCQEFWVRGGVRRIAHYRLPLSEGVANGAYAGVGLQMLRTALQTEPLLYALGMGGEDRPLPRLLRASGWRLLRVPFYFKVLHPQRFLGEVRMLRTSAVRRVAAWLARWTGTGWVCLRLLDAFKTAPREPAALEVVGRFEAWADEIWTQCRRRYALIAARDSAVLNSLYPPGSRRYIRLAVLRDGQPLGWAVLLDTEMRDHRQFGNLRVGTIADCLSAPEDAAAVISQATEFLAGRGVDLIVSNQSHGAWCAALERSGFLRGPSNYVFAASKELAQQLEPFEAACPKMHINRGDGDGPIHL
jgi:hypothetical protein